MMKLDNLNYVTIAEDVIKKIGRQNPRDPGKLDFFLTTSKIRNILSMVSDVYNRVLHTNGQEIDNETRSKIVYMKMRIAYEVGRDPKSLNDFVREANLLQYIDEIGSSKEKAIVFCQYMESLVAYHRYYGGKDS